MQHKRTLCSSTELQRPKDGVHTSGGSGHRAAADGNTQWANVDHALACRDAAWQLVANDVQGRAKHLGRCRFAAGEQAGCACSAALMAVLLQQQVKSIRAPSPPPHTLQCCTCMRLHTCSRCTASVTWPGLSADIKRPSVAICSSLRPAMRGTSERVVDRGTCGKRWPQPVWCVSGVCPCARGNAALNPAAAWLCPARQHAGADVERVPDK